MIHLFIPETFALFLMVSPQGSVFRGNPRLTMMVTDAMLLPVREIINNAAVTPFVVLVSESKDGKIHYNEVAGPPDPDKNHYRSLYVGSGPVYENWNNYDLFWYDILNQMHWYRRGVAAMLPPSYYAKCVFHKYHCNRDLDIFPLEPTTK